MLFLLLLVACGADWLAPERVDEANITLRLLPPSFKNPFGRDLFGGDMLTQAIFGARTTAIISFATLANCVMMGTLVGLLCGYWRGKFDRIIMRVIDILLAFPGILLAMTLAAFLGPRTSNVIIAISVTGWTSIARLVRAQVMSLTEKDYITAARALGLKTPTIIFRHILPNVLSPLVVLATFNLAGIILVEASLSFLGLGAQDSHPSWGNLLNQGRSVMIEAPHLSIIPGFLIMTLVLAINLLGDFLRDYTDPKMGS